MSTWTWPNLSGDENGLSPEGIWFPTQKERLYPIIFSAINFVTLQIEEDGVSSQSMEICNCNSHFPRKEN